MDDNAPSRTAYTCVLDVPGSNLNRITDYILGLSRFSCLCTREYLETWLPIPYHLTIRDNLPNPFDTI
jgi:hypothetical protein